MRLGITILIFCLLLKIENTYGMEYGRAPTFRGKLGMSLTHFKLGNQYQNQPLGTLFVFQPTLLWDLPAFQSRVGIHYLTEFGGPFGVNPLSGIGVSAYFYPVGISSNYEFTPDNVLLQKTKSGPFLCSQLTPVNFNLNKKRLGDGSGQPDLSVFSEMIEFGIGGGFDYSFRTNMILAVEMLYRYAAAQQDKTGESIIYSGPTIFFTFSAAYY